MRRLADAREQAAFWRQAERRVGAAVDLAFERVVGVKGKDRREAKTKYEAAAESKCPYPVFRMLCEDAERLDSRLRAGRLRRIC
mgnify:CR=1 FL=1